VKSATGKVLPYVVAVGPGGTGVIVSEDGLVLSQAHVTHGAWVLNLAESDKKGNERGRTIKVYLHDGSEVIADVLGRDVLYDLSVVKLRKPGPYPHATLSETLPEPGGWLLKIGYPLNLGYRKGRPPEVRLGKLLYRAETTFLTDCLLNGGDSGGPYFDLDGGLVGILKSARPIEGLPFPDNLVMKTGGWWWHATPAKLIRARLEAMTRGEVLRATPAEVSKYQKPIRAGELLAEDRRTQGAKTLEDFREAAKAARGSVVEVLDGDATASLGTVVDADGLVLTKASELPDGARCRLADARVLAARVVGVDPAYDLALLRVPANGLKPIEWAANADTPVGTLVAAAGAGPLPVKVGMVSLPVQEFGGPFAKAVPRRSSRVLPPAVLGSGVPGRGYWVEFAEGDAAAAGVRPGDLLISVAGVPVRAHEDVVACVEGRRGGDRVPVHLIRSGKSINLTLPLKTDSTAERPGGVEAVLYSRHRAKPPVALPVALPVVTNECGGPLVGLDGKALGLVLGRPEITFALVLPAERVVARLKDLKEGRPIATFPTGPPKGKPVAATAEEILGKLKERTDRYNSLLVEYDVTTEADVDPRLLLAWQLNVGRDFRERHRVAFRGPKLLTEVTSPKVFALLAPMFEVSPDPAAPADVSRQVETARRADAEKSKAGRVDHRFRYSGGTVRRSLFDGKNMSLAPFFYGPTDYLANVGLRPLNPKPGDAAAEQAWRLPGNFARLPGCRVRPAEEAVDGAGCVVLEVPLAQGTETVWLDSALGYAPRKWEVRDGDRLVWRRSNKEFREFAPGCWLPLEADQAVGPPAWASLGSLSQPAYTRHMALRYARVNDVPDSVFAK
jgi:serine protease Do